MTKARAGVAFWELIVMAFVVFLLLSGMLATEIALFGVETAGVVGAVLLLCCAIALALQPTTDDAA